MNPLERFSKVLLPTGNPSATLTYRGHGANVTRKVYWGEKQIMLCKAEISRKAYQLGFDGLLALIETKLSDENNWSST